MSLPTVIYTHGGGRLGNQLIRLAHWLAWIEENERKVALIDMGFWPYATDFVEWTGNRGCGYPVSRAWSNVMSGFLYSLPESISRRAEWRLQHWIHALGARRRRWQRVGSTVQLAEIDLESPAFLESVSMARVTTCAGWRISCWNLFHKHESLTRKLLRPDPRLEASAKKSIGEIRARADIIAGVMIRHGDYRRWRDGRYFFETSVYVNAMRSFAEMHPDRRVSFLVTSDEVQNENEFVGLDVTFSKGSANMRGRAIDALLELAACDAILAPPSTFSAWAAHWGRVPIWPVGAAENAEWQPVPGELIAIHKHPYLGVPVA